MYVTPKSPKGGSKREFITFCVAFHIFVAGKLFKFGIWVKHSKSQL